MIEPWLRARLPKGGRVALDIGANVGTWAAWLAGRFEHVQAFEPNPQALPALRQLAPDVTVIEAAVGARPGEAELRLYGQSVHASLLDRADLDAQGSDMQCGTVTVPVVSLDSLGCDQQPVDFIKIDTEGYETQVLLGAELTLALNMPELLIEVHVEANGAACTTLLGDLGYDVEVIPHPHRGVPAGHHWIYARGGSDGE